ncbi:TOMM system kinase/cyclase fusion protein [Dyella mobilis]|uniref:TOMM system kinase/cyclase fusion protein n=1 Tax=Dyella mobilis TaxID=1849582 RepID=A0ABS2KAT5_9GAMM|nr:TOMM system kinase/cyclase fusion protein [Dyella mobilis]MBM7128302.1 TOMM system kinase/cyclase fusion protein [Dyella mobilis]GLQ99863.1 protein kinase [Dyella mobilis]
MQTDQLANELLERGYRISGRLGRGGTSQVWRGEQISTGQTVALKVINLEAHLDPGRRQRMAMRFDRETQICGQLHHAHIVRLLDKGSICDTLWFAAFEYIPGTTLADLLLQRSALEPEAACELMLQILDALACAHDAGIVHRDLKPQNIMISQTGRRPQAKVLDFGIGTVVSERQSMDAPRLTMTNETLGTPSYGAPEQLRGEAPSVKGDLYAWGLIFLECLTGQQAIRGATLAEVFHQQLNPHPVALPHSIIDHPLAELLRRVLQKDVALRAHDARQVYDDLRRIDIGNLVGKLTPQHPPVGDTLVDGQTLRPAQLRQITTLCCNLTLVGPTSAATYIDTMDVLLSDQIRLCMDTGVRFGGYFGGALGGTLRFYFGYPKASDTDARRAARTALELLAQVRQRSQLLEASRGCALELTAGLHTGMVVVRHDQLPDGLAPMVAQRLERLAPANNIVVSQTTRTILDRHISFEAYSMRVPDEHGHAIGTNLMIGERETEAHVFLQPGSPDISMIGREEECLHLQRAWHSAVSGQGSSWLIVGDAGIGKSRLVRETASEAERFGGMVLECHCLSERRNNALYPILRLLSATLQQDQATDELSSFERLSRALADSGESEEALPILCSWMGICAPDSLAPALHAPVRQRQILLSAIKAMLMNHARGRPLLVCIEDVHWADPTTMEWLALMEGDLADRHVFLLMTSRPVDATTLCATKMEIGPLSHADVLAMVRQIGQRKGLSEQTVQAISDRADGIPLFAEELVRVAITPRTDATRDVLNEVPATLLDTLAQLLDTAGDAKDTAQWAAAIGREFDSELLMRVSTRDRSEIHDDLQTLVAAGVLHRKRLVAGDCYVFRHALIRDAAYGSMLQRTRESVHERIGLQLEASGHTDRARVAADLAYHFSKATHYAKAIPHGVAASQSALERGLYEDALQFAERCLDWCEKLPDDERPKAEFDVRTLLTLAGMSKYGWVDPRVADNAQRTLTLSSQVASDPRAVPSLWALATYHHVAGHRTETHQIAQRMEAITLEANDVTQLVAARNVLGMCHWIEGNYCAAADTLEWVWRNYDAVPQANLLRQIGVDSRVWSMAALANVRWFTVPNGTEALEMAAGTVREAEGLNHIPSLCLALLYQALVLQHAGERKLTMIASSRAMGMAQRYGIPAIGAYTSIMYGWAQADLSLVCQSIGALENLGCLLGFTYYPALAANIELEQGQPERALARIDACITRAECTGERYYLAELYCRKADILQRLQTASATTDIIASLECAQTHAQATGMQRTLMQCRYRLQTLQATPSEWTCQMA